MELEIGKGIEQNRFGLRKAEVTKAVAARDTEHYADDGSRRPPVNELRCNFRFRDDRLHSIRCSKAALTVFGRLL